MASSPTEVPQLHYSAAEELSGFYNRKKSPGLNPGNGCTKCGNALKPLCCKLLAQQFVRPAWLRPTAGNVSRVCNQDFREFEAEEKSPIWGAALGNCLFFRHLGRQARVPQTLVSLAASATGTFLRTPPARSRHSNKMEV